MKQRIFNKGRGWYISCTNRNDPQDKSYINVGFTRETEPPYRPIGDQEFVFIDIDIQEAKFNSYKNKPSMFVFKYEQIDHNDSLTEVERQGEEYAKYVGKNVVAPDDLPFY